MNLKAGDKMLMTQKGRDQGLHQPSGCISGTFVRYSRNGRIVVQSDHCNTPGYFHRDFWERAPEIDKHFK